MKSALFKLRIKKTWLVATLVLITVLNLFLINNPIKSTFEYDPDEGTQLMKSALYFKGFSLYKEIWDDQPPLFTVIVSSCFKLFGLSAYPARLMALFFSGLLLFAFYLSIRKLSGFLCAFTAMIFLILSACYVRLSASVMAGLPCLTFALWAVYCAILYKDLRLKWLLILSAGLMAVSAQIKLFSALLIPVVLTYIMIPLRREPKTNIRGNYLGILTYWLGTFCAVFVIITLMFFNLNIPLFWQQLFQPHLNRLFPEKTGLSIIAEMTFADYDIVLLAFTGIILFFKQKKKELFLPVAWLVLICIIFSFYRPLWYHYYPLVSIPLCWLAGNSFSEFFRMQINRDFPMRKNFPRSSPVILLVLSILLLPLKYGRMLESINGRTTIQEKNLVNFISEYKGSWIVTDRPMFAFYCGLLVPPEIALISNKRLYSRNFSDRYLNRILKTYKPNLLLLGRFKDYEKKILSFADNDYSMIRQPEVYTHLWLPKYLNRTNIISAHNGQYISSGKKLRLYIRKTGGQ